MLYLNVTDSCCALTEIVNLHTHRTAKSAMKEFCRKVYGGNRFFTIGRQHAGGFYIFNGVVGYTTSDKKPKYCVNFAKFIEDNGLGEVTASVKGPNVHYHPTHIVQIWTWKPNDTALYNWYKQNGD